MPILMRFGSWLLGGLIASVPSMVGQLLVGLGVAAITYTGMDATLTWLKSGVVTALLGLPPDVVGMLSLMQVGSCISMVFSAFFVRLSLLGLKGVTKRLVAK